MKIRIVVVVIGWLLLAPSTAAGQNQFLSRRDGSGKAKRALIRIAVKSTIHCAESVIGRQGWTECKQGTLKNLGLENSGYEPGNQPIPPYTNFPPYTKYWREPKLTLKPQINVLAAGDYRSNFLLRLRREKLFPLLPLRPSEGRRPQKH